MNLRLSIFWIPLVFTTACSRSPHDAREEAPLPPASVTTIDVKAQDTPVMEEVVGTVRPRLEANVSAKVTGRVLSLEATPGRRVKKGELLAKIDPGEMTAVLEAARATMEQAMRDKERADRLAAQNAIAQAELEKATAQLRVSSARVKEAESLIANAEVTAPFDGVVTRKLMEPGDLATPGRALFSMEDQSLLRLEIDVAESLAGKISLGQTLRVEVEGAGAEIDGKVSEVAPSADVGSRTFRIKLDLPSTPALRAGQFGRALLPRGMRKALMVPLSSIIRRGQMDYVFVATEGKAHLRIVRLGHAGKDRVEVLAGLDDGEKIVGNPSTELRDGQALKQP